MCGAIFVAACLGKVAPCIALALYISPLSLSLCALAPSLHAVDAQVQVAVYSDRQNRPFICALEVELRSLNGLRVICSEVMMILFGFSLNPL